MLGTLSFSFLSCNVLISTVLKCLVVSKCIGEGGFLLTARQAVLLTIEVTIHHHTELRYHIHGMTKLQIPWEAPSSYGSPIPSYKHKMLTLKKDLVSR